MKTTIPLWLCLGSLAIAQEKSPAPAVVSGVKGVKEEAVANVKNIEPGIKTATKNDAQGVNKINGVKTDENSAVTPPVNPVPPPPVTGTASTAKGVNKIDGVKAAGQTAPVPVQPVISGAGSIQAVNGVTGINAAKLQNLEAALKIKDETGPHDGKGKAAAAALGGPPGKPGKVPKDGREGFQEFEKLKTNGS